MNFTLMEPSFILVCGKFKYKSARHYLEVDMFMSSSEDQTIFAFNYVVAYSRWMPCVSWALNFQSFWIV